MSRNIKDYNGILTKFVFSNLIIIFIPDLVNSDNYKDYATYLTEVGMQNGLGLLIASILTLFINGLYKSEYKYILVFWKVKDNLPGYRVFTDLAKKDHRIDYEELTRKYAPLPTKPSLQNKLWYRVLKKYPDEETILQSHRDFLLFRDLTIIAFSLMVIYLSIFLLSKISNLDLNVLYVFIFAIEYLLLVVITRNKAERFTLNVIAHDLNNG